jgi:ABC-type sugar transport system ATPase subunit
MIGGGKYFSGPRHAARRGGGKSFGRRCAIAGELLQSLGVDLNPGTLMRGLSIADQQMVELAAALSVKARVLLMDEPTASLTPREVERLFAIVRRLRDSGVAVVFIRHRIPEVFEISDRITVLRDGKCIGTRAVAQTAPEEIIRMMVGRPLNALYEKPPSTPGATMLEVKELSRPSAGQQPTHSCPLASRARCPEHPA